MKISRRQASPRVGLLWLVNRRPVRFLLVLLLVPVVVFSNPVSASAATGPWVAVSAEKAVTIPRLGGVTYLSCTAQLQQGGGALINLGTKGYCLGSPDQTPGLTQPGEANSSLVVKLSGLTASGVTCIGSVSVTLGQHPSNGYMRVAGSIPGAGINMTSSDCQVTRVCFTLSAQIFSEELCTATTIPALGGDEEPVEGACAAGRPLLEFKWRDNGPWLYNGQPQGNYREWQLWIKLTVNGAPPISTASWGVSPIGGYAPSTGIDMTNDRVWTGRLEYSPTKPGGPFTGVEVYAYAPNGWNAPVHDAASQLIDTDLPTASGDPYGGWTQPEHCRWWFGPKVVDSTTTDADEPAGDGLPYAEPEPDPEPDIVQPVPVEEPGTDLGWLALIWGLLDTIKSTIANLASSIVNGIRSMFSGLFVPDESLEDRSERMADRFDHKFPFNVTDQLAGLGLGGTPLGPRVNTAPQAPAVGTACPTWDVVVPVPTGEAVKKFDAVCDSTFTQAIRGARPFLLVAMMVAAFWPLVRGLFYASIPLIKPTPSDSR